METQFLEHYNRELAYLRDLGSEFAKRFPAVAGRLKLDENECADPFVERLLEGFAFLAARVHRRMDAEFPEFTQGLLETIYPHYTRPIPSAAIVQLHPDKDEGSLIEGYHLPRGTTLMGPSTDQQPTACRFDTTEPLDLWPLQIADAAVVTREMADGRSLPEKLAAFDARGYLRLTLETTAGIPLAALAIDSLKLQLVGGQIAWELYEALTSQVCCVALRGAEDEGAPWFYLPETEPLAHGFADQESLLPGEPRSFSGYRLLSEYFLLPEKFLAFKFQGINRAVRAATGKRLEIVIGLRAMNADWRSSFSRHNLALHCVPTVNLFSKRADRTRVSPQKFEHHLMVDRGRPMDYEIWSIEQLCGHGSAPREEFEYLPLYAPPSDRRGAVSPDSKQGGRYYAMSRRPRQPSANQLQYGHRSDYLGSEAYVELTDRDPDGAGMSIQQLSATVYCTNRDLPLVAPVRGWREALRMAGPGPVSRVECLIGPTAPRPSLASVTGERCWRLINLLTPNHLSFGCGTDANYDGRLAAAMTREMWTLHAHPGHAAQARQVEGIQRVCHSVVTRQLPFPGPIVHGRGTRIELTLDESAFEGGSPYLLAAVWEQFLSRFASLNSFTQLQLNSATRGALYRWPPRMGDVAPL